MNRLEDGDLSGRVGMWLHLALEFEQQEFEREDSFAGEGSAGGVERSWNLREGVGTWFHLALRRPRGRACTSAPAFPLRPIRVQGLWFRV